MHRQLHLIAISLISFELVGCAQATRHSNTMLFATNTEFGIRAGASASSSPEVNVGYSRQEAVILPLVANSRDNGTYQLPCDMSLITVTQTGWDRNPCLLVSSSGSSVDSYSVLASFGANFDASTGGGPHANGALAQYFATGMAARLLAAAAAPAVVGVEQPMGPYEQFKAKLLAKVQLTKDAELSTRIADFEKATGTTNHGIAAGCGSVAACEQVISANDPYFSAYGQNQTAFDTALSAWNTDESSSAPVKK